MMATLPPDEREKAKLVEYIRTMIQELAIMADHAGQSVLADHLRAAPPLIDRRRH